MTPTRVLFAAMSPMLRDIITRALAARPDVSVVAEVPRAEGVDDELRRSGAGAVITCSEDGRLPERYRQLLYGFPGLRVVVLTADGRAAALYRLVLHRTRWTDVSPQEVAAALRHGDDRVEDDGHAARPIA